MQWSHRRWQDQLSRKSFYGIYEIACIRSVLSRSLLTVSRECVCLKLRYQMKSLSQARSLVKPILHENIRYAAWPAIHDSRPIRSVHQFASRCLWRTQWRSRCLGGPRRSKNVSNPCTSLLTIETILPAVRSIQTQASRYSRITRLGDLFLMHNIDCATDSAKAVWSERDFQIMLNTTTAILITRVLECA